MDMPYSKTYTTINSVTLLCYMPAACIAALLISKAYLIAMSCGVLEYLAESALLPSLKQLHAVSYCGLVLLVLGECIRKAAMVSSNPLSWQHPWSQAGSTPGIQRRHIRDVNSLLPAGLVSMCYCATSC
jgi:hypothetical protein